MISSSGVNCDEPIPQTKRGRPQRFCKDKCRQAHRKIATPPENGLRYRTGRVKLKAALQASEFLRECEPENLSQKTDLRFERVKFAAVWVREKPGGDVEHCHLLFNLPTEYRIGARHLQLEAAIYRLVKRHGGDYTDERVVRLEIHHKLPYPDGKYFLKGGGRKVFWRLFRLKKDHRRIQGIIHGKRCGTTENIGHAECARWRQSKEGVA
jgi:hypothetical protein